MQTHLSQYLEMEMMVRSMRIFSQSTSNAGSSDFVNVHKNKLVAVGDEHWEYLRKRVKVKEKRENPKSFKMLDA